MHCDELLAALNEYVDGTANPAICEELRRHLAACDPCQVVLDNLRQTITLYRQGQPIELPPACRERLHAALRERWRQLHPAPPTA